MQHHWFTDAVLYQIYPRSFYDSNGDGVGDLRGIIQKMDYLRGGPESLGVDAIWLTPFYTSPMVDFGYDIANYTDVDPVFGTLDDFRDLLREAHARDIRVVVDYVPNHSSDKHAWFQESRSSRTSPKRNWYVWRDAKPDGSPPNNWQSAFGGSAWEFDPQTSQYYLHSFSAGQPDLDWTNSEVREAMKDVLRFWLDLGVDGFRVDAVYWLSKDPDYADDPPNPAYKPGIDDPYHMVQHSHSKQGKDLYKYLQEIADVVGSYPEKFMITEAYPHKWNDANAYVQFYEHVNAVVSAPFNFEAIFAPWNARSFKKFIDSFQQSLKADYVTVYSVGNHDKPRIASRIGQKAARTAAMMLLSLPGMPVVYYGDELGMRDVVVDPAQSQDPAEKRSPGLGLGRDPERTPMPWDNSAQSGFTTGTPWLPVEPRYLTHNIQAQLVDPSSSLELYRAMLQLRKSSPALHYGNYEPLATDPNVFGYARNHPSQKMIVLLNFSAKEVVVQLAPGESHLRLSTYMDFVPMPENGAFHLRPHEGVIIEVV